MLLQVIAALTQHKAGGATDEATLGKLVTLLQERPHLLCGLTMWVPENELQEASTPAYCQLRDGVTATLSNASSKACAVTV